MVKILELKIKIEELRNKMQSLIEKSVYINSDIVAVSRELDKLIGDYYNSLESE